VNVITWEHSYIPRLSSACLRQEEALKSEQEIIRELEADETGRLSKNLTSFQWSFAQGYNDDTIWIGLELDLQTQFS
jgi:hypothetical protein